VFVYGRVKMNRDVSPLRFQAAVFSATGSTCGACGVSFKNPLLAMVFNESVVEEYYACPNCLSKVASLRQESNVAEVDAAEDVEDEYGEPVVDVAVEGDVEELDGCAHQLGYLKQRPKNTPIPEECLTCSKMINCMY
jgi:DNA-directed RNA polymerase subunit RPC12/RpoP